MPVQHVGTTYLVLGALGVLGFACGARSELDTANGSSSHGAPTGIEDAGESEDATDDAAERGEAGADASSGLSVSDAGTIGMCSFGTLGDGITCLSSEVFDSYTRTTFASLYCTTISGDECGTSQTYTRASYLCCPATCRGTSGDGLCESLASATQDAIAYCAEFGFPPTAVVLPSPFDACDGGFTSFAASCCP
jgi:hypothetical protein